MFKLLIISSVLLTYIHESIGYQNQDKIYFSTHADKFATKIANYTAEIKSQKRQEMLALFTERNSEENIFDIDLSEDLQSNLSSLGSKMPSRKSIFSTPVLNHQLSLDSCSYNCSKVRHIACGHNWSLSPRCSVNAKLINLTHLQPLILNLHNTFRNDLAGHLTLFEPAVRMSTIQWNPELAAYAELNVMTCKSEHDYCHNTKEFNLSGQNLALFKWWGLKKKLENIITNTITNWYMESINAAQSDLDNFQRLTGWNNMVIGHFTNIVNERNTDIGCGAVVEKQGNFNTIYFTCNYAHNNILNKPIYVKGPAASKCTTGENPKFKYLCSINEVYN